MVSTTLTVTVPVGTQDPTAKLEVSTVYNRGHSCEQQLDHESHHECIACFSHAVTCTRACQNGGTCHTNSFSAHCVCSSGFSGSYCQYRGGYEHKQKLCVCAFLLYLLLYIYPTIYIGSM